MTRSSPREPADAEEPLHNQEAEVRDDDPKVEHGQPAPTRAMRPGMANLRSMRAMTVAIDTQRAR